MTTTFSSAGKIGDCLHQWPIPFWWHKQTGESFDLWLDEKTLGPLVPLFQAQPGVSEVKLIGGIDHHRCGGQPWHFNLKTEDHRDRRIIHLGFRGFPNRQLTLETLKTVPLTLEVEPDLLAETPTIAIPPDVEDLMIEPHIVPSGQNLNIENLYIRPGRIIKINGPRRLVLHGQGVYGHTRQCPTFWKFLASVRDELGTLFEEVAFVGSARDREVGLAAYPAWTEFDDGGDFLKLARFLADSRCVIGVGSSVAALAGQLKVPCIRVHDMIGDAPKSIWSNLGRNQLNATELELRKEWPEWRDRWIKGLDAVVIDPVVTPGVISSPLLSEGLYLRPGRVIRVEGGK